MDFLNSWPVLIGLCLCIGLGFFIPLGVVIVLLVRNAKRRQ